MRLFSLSVLTMLALALFSCARGAVPVSPSEDRERDDASARFAQDFLPDNVREVFGPDTSGTASHGVDSGIIGEYPRGDPARITFNGGFTTEVTAFVSLERRDADRFIPVYRLITNDGQDALTTDARDVPDVLQQCYNFPKCAAIRYTDANDRDVVELTVCYMWRGSAGADWDVGVTRIRWHSAQHASLSFEDLQGDPDDVLDEIWNADGFAPGWDEVFPDIAYDYEREDMYIVYSDYAHGPDPYSDVHLMYRHFSRITQSWCDEYWCQWHEEPYNEQNGGTVHAHNAWHPRIDVGLMDTLFPSQDTMAVGIAYAAQYH